MIDRKDRTMDLYMQIGAEARFIKRMMCKFIVDSSKILYAPDTAKLMSISRKMDVIISGMEDQMFRDYQDLGHDYINVFYGAPDTETLNGVDAEVKEIMADMLREIMGGDPH